MISGQDDTDVLSEYFRENYKQAFADLASWREKYYVADRALAIADLKRKQALSTAASYRVATITFVLTTVCFGLGWALDAAGIVLP